MPSTFEDALARNLDFLRWLTERVVEAGTPTRRGQFIKEYGKALERHFAAVEDIVVPALQARGATGRVWQSLLAHQVLRPRLASVLQDSARKDADGDRRAMRLLFEAHEHLEREAAVLVPLVRDHFGADEIGTLGARVRTRLDNESLPTGETSTLDAAQPPCPTR